MKIVVCTDYKSALSGYGEYLLTDQNEPTAVTLQFGLLGVLRAGTSSLGQFLGKTTYSFYPLVDRTLVIAVDSKSHNSFNPLVKFSGWLLNEPEAGNFERSSLKETNFSRAMTNTRQTYMFFLDR